MLFGLAENVRASESIESEKDLMYCTIETAVDYGYGDEVPDVHEQEDPAAAKRICKPSTSLRRSSLKVASSYKGPILQHEFAPSARTIKNMKRRASIGSTKEFTNDNIPSCFPSSQGTAGKRRLSVDGYYFSSSETTTTGLGKGRISTRSNRYPPIEETKELIAKEPADMECRKQRKKEKMLAQLRALDAMLAGTTTIEEKPEPTRSSLSALGKVDSAPKLPKRTE